MNELFVSMPFNKAYNSVFNVLRTCAKSRQLEAIRVDQTPSQGPISAAVHRRIRDARLVVADITANNPNVLNEVGLAEAFGKPLILISQDKREEAPFNVRNLYIHKYSPTNLPALQAYLTKALAEATSDNEMLRAMLVPASLGRPSKESWFVVAASPLSFRRATGRHGGYKNLQRTSSDYVGIRGILQSFGLLFGFDALPENVDPDDCEDSVVEAPMNVYCIASPKANRWTSLLLNGFAEHWEPRLRFQADPDSPDVRNVRLSVLHDRETVRIPGWRDDVEDRRYRDFGIIVRGPNPFNSRHVAAVIGGRSSLGTEAASLGFTDPPTIREIHRQLDNLKIDLEDHTQAFWVVVSMERDRETQEPVTGSLKVDRVAGFRAKGDHRRQA